MSPLKAKPAPVRVACETLRLALPGLLKVIVCVLPRPTVTFPKLTLAGTTEICGCTPAPESTIVAGEFVALLATLTLPDALPGAVGANCALKVLDCPGARENGKVKPLMAKPAPVTLPCEIFKLAVPELVKVTVWALAVPTITFPKLTVLGVIES